MSDTGGLAAEAPSYSWNLRGRTVDLRTRTAIMGILNVTPDSFSDGGRFRTAAEAVEAALQMHEDGADIIDVGGESTRPGRPQTVSAEEEAGRVLPVVEGLLRDAPGLLVSVDTYKGEVARQALDAGAHLINDVYALRNSPEIATYCASAGAGLLLMHMQGTPETMQQSPRYRDVLVEVGSFLRDQMRTAVSAGVPEECIAVDPGIGFGKTLEHNLDLLAGLEYLRLLQRPICIGASRKGFLGRICGDLPVSERVESTIAAHCAAVLHGASIVRVHDVKQARLSLQVIDAIRARQ